MSLMASWDTSASPGRKAACLNAKLQTSKRLPSRYARKSSTRVDQRGSERGLWDPARELSLLLRLHQSDLFLCDQLQPGFEKKTHS